MRRSALAAFLVIAWIALSGLDLVEDLKQFYRHPSLQSSTSSDPVSAKQSGWRTLANNIVEFAHRTSSAIATACIFSDSAGDATRILEFRSYFARHKLFRVFLI